MYMLTRLLTRLRPHGLASEDHKSVDYKRPIGNLSFFHSRCRPFLKIFNELAHTKSLSKASYRADKLIARLVRSLILAQTTLPSYCKYGLWSLAAQLSVSG